MSITDVKSLLLLSSNNFNSSYSILFHCARFWAQQGNRILFISKTPLRNLPLAVGKADVFLNPDAFKLIQFISDSLNINRQQNLSNKGKDFQNIQETLQILYRRRNHMQIADYRYLGNWQELLQQLYSIHLRHNPVSVIIVKNLENYFKHDHQAHCLEDHISLVCASLLYAISTCAKMVSHPVFLISEYVCGDCSIERVVVKNFFHNIWQLERNKDENERTFKFSKLSAVGSDEIVGYKFVENLAETRLSFDEVIKSIISIF